VSSPHDCYGSPFGGVNVTERKKPPKPEGYSAFKRLLEKLVKVPKREIDEKEAEYQREREQVRKTR
jgi:hypothetical protein